MSSFIKSTWISRAYNFGLSYRDASILIILSFLATVSEILGIGIFLPIFQFIRMEGDLDALVADTNIWQYVIDGFDYFNLEVSFALLLFLSFFFFLTRQIFTYLRLVFNAAVKQRLIQKQRNNVFNNYIKADTSYHDSTPVGDLLNVIQTEVDRAVMGVMTPFELLVYIVMFLGYILMLSTLSWPMTLLALVVFLMVGVIPGAWIKQSKKTGRNLVGANTIMSEFLVGRLRSPRLVRLSGTESAEKDEFYRLTLTQRKYRTLSAILQTKTDTVMEPIIIGLSLVFLYLAHIVLQLQLEVIGLYLVIAMRLMPIVKTILMLIQSIQNLLGSIEILEVRLNKMKDSQEEDNGSENLTQIEKSILINKVSYRYPYSKFNALKDITIRIKAHEMIAIVGPSGSGKSTLIDLLPRLRLPTDGVIQIDNENIDKYRLESLRKLISYVPQTPQIFNGTVKNHILYGKKDATDEEVKEAARLADAEGFINQLPQGFETILGEDAIKLSGGQRQRLDLARALVKKAAILILDEPTSNLDAESEENFKKVISKIRQKTNTTIIIVSHRLASISNSDQIVVLNKGVVEAIGMHTELLKEKGWYSKAWQMQESKVSKLN